MTNQNSTCCNAPVMVSAGDEGTACYVCRHCMKAYDIAEQNSKCCGRKGIVNGNTGEVFCEGCLQPLHTPSKSEEIKMSDCCGAQIYNTNGEKCAHCHKLCGFIYYDHLPTPRLENWEENMFELFSDNMQPLLEIAEGKKDIETWNSSVQNAFENIKSFISTLLQEERNKMSDKLEKIIEIKSQGEMRTAIYDEICNLQQSNEK